MKKKIISLLIAAMAFSTLAVACTQKEEDTNETASTSIETDQQLEESSSINGAAKDKISDSSSQKTVYPLTMEVKGPDGNSYTQTFESAPQKVITNNPSATELLFELGLKDVIVGTMALDNAAPEKWAADYETLPVIGDKKTTSKEVLVSAEPDLILGRAFTFTEESFGTIPAFNDLGIQVYTQKSSYMNTEQTMENIIEDVRNTGEIFDVQEKANHYADSLQDTLDEVTAKVAAQKNENPLKVMVMVNYTDGTFAVFGADASLQSSVLNTLGAVNVMEKGGNSLTFENLAEANPDIIIYITADRNASVDALAKESLLKEETIQSVEAIKNKKIIEIGYDDFMDYGTRLFDTLKTLSDFFYQ
jgi:iron complex transport system substrate-binding protein